MTPTTQWRAGGGAIIIIDVICPFPYPIRVSVVPKPMWKR